MTRDTEEFEGRKTSGWEMSLVGKDGHFVGAEIDSSLAENNNPFLFLLSTTEQQSDYLKMEDNMLFTEESDNPEQDLALIGFNFSLCLIPEVSLTGNQGEYKIHFLKEKNCTILIPVSILLLTN